VTGSDRRSCHDPREHSGDPARRRHGHPRLAVARGEDLAALRAGAPSSSSPTATTSTARLVRRRARRREGRRRDRVRRGHRRRGRHFPQGRASAAPARRRDGGPILLPRPRRAAREVHDVLTEDVQNRYLVTYTPLNQRARRHVARDQRETHDPTHVVRTRARVLRPEAAADQAGHRVHRHRSVGQLPEPDGRRSRGLENGQVQQLESFQEAVQPVSVVLALDASGSMRRKEAGRRRQRARVHRRASPAGPARRRALRRSSGHSRTTCPRTASISSAPSRLPARAAARRLYDALGDALIRLKRTSKDGVAWSS
jgi:hypothetical protein